MNYTYIFILIAGVLVSGLSVLFFTIKERWLKLTLSFSGSFLFAISVLHLIPELYKESSNTVGIYILAGFFLQIFLEYFSEGIEHGHVHIHKESASHFPFAVILSLSIHSFLEGMPISNDHRDIQSNQNLLTGIVLHNIPIAIALMSMLLKSNVSRNKAIIALCTFALMSPLGMVFSGILGSSAINLSSYFNNIMGVVVGVFLHISTTILFESSENHKLNLIKFLVILSGAALAMFTL